MIIGGSGLIDKLSISEIEKKILESGWLLDRERFLQMTLEAVDETRGAGMFSQTLAGNHFSIYDNL